MVASTQTKGLCSNEVRFCNNLDLIQCVLLGFFFHIYRGTIWALTIFCGLAWRECLHCFVSHLINIKFSRKPYFTQEYHSEALFLDTNQRIWWSICNILTTTIIKWMLHLHQVQLSLLHALCGLITQSTLWCNIIITIHMLQVRKLRHCEAKQAAWGRSAGSGRGEL